MMVLAVKSANHAGLLPSTQMGVVSLASITNISRY